MKAKSIVIAGGGHAGIEAAIAASNIGIRVIMVTMDEQSIGRMSCNPAIGGLGKGHLVKEIDAMGGLMGRAADECGIQFKTLNTSKGRAVWSSRAQIDKKSYPYFIKLILNSNKNITILQDEVVDFTVNNCTLKSVLLRSGNEINTSALIVCSGTFFRGLIHIGDRKYSAGRFGEKPSIDLTESIVNKGFRLSRLKTGTPPRLLSSSINWSKTRLALGDENPVPFSMLTQRPFKPKNIPCHIVDTNSQTHQILGDNLDKSAMYSGKIKGIGPRYCPSIEDKIVRFREREKHQLFLEPEWIGSNQIYLNGFSTSMPQYVQELALRQISGLENVELIRPGYAIEYDYFPTAQLKSTLETKSICGLYFAGQLNGTSGYEEAAAQGLVAGANAALKILGKESLILKRDQAYIGVLIDDLITKDINEPYRMFTSSAEHRLSLRSDNAGLRLTELAHDVGLVSKKQYVLFSKYRDQFSEIKHYCSNTNISIDGERILLFDYIKRPEGRIKGHTNSCAIFNTYSPEALFSAETEIKYEGYVKIENMRVEQLKRLETIKIPFEFDYSSLSNLSTESKEKLARVMPETLGQASRLAGVRPSDVGVLAIYLQSNN